MPKKGQEVDNKYLYAFITVLVILITTVYCISVVSAHNPLPFCAAGETTVQTSENTQAPPSDELAGSKQRASAPCPPKRRDRLSCSRLTAISPLYAMRLDLLRPVSGEEPTYEFHHGIDISTSRAAYTHCADGEVVFNRYDSSYGYYLMIDHGSFVSLYAHCESFYCAAGDRVFAGELIATAGSTGRSTGPHLHFEIRVGGKAVDPLLYVGCVYAGTIY